MCGARNLGRGYGQGTETIMILILSSLPNTAPGYSHGFVLRFYSIWPIIPSSSLVLNSCFYHFVQLLFQATSKRAAEGDYLYICFYFNVSLARDQRFREISFSFSWGSSGGKINKTRLNYNLLRISRQERGSTNYNLGYNVCSYLEPTNTIRLDF